MIRLLIAGSPCTKWSIAQKNNRETEPRGWGWELFKNYLIAKEKFKPDFFLYENNKSAADSIKQQISRELKAWDVDSRFLMPSQAQYIEINSALVSAQNRERFYVHNFPNVFQPEDRQIFLKDIIESGIVEKEKSYCLTHVIGNSRDYFKKHQTNVAFEPVIYQKPHGDNRGYMITDKAPTLTAKAFWQENNQVLEPVCLAQRGRAKNKGDKMKQQFEIRQDGKTNCITTVDKNNLIAEPIRIGEIENDSEGDSKQYRVYSPEGKATALCGNGGGMGAKTGLYAIPCGTNFKDKSRTITAGYSVKQQRDFEQDFITGGQLGATGIIEPATYNGKHIYEVKNGIIKIKDKEYPIRLPDGFYIIRKLTVKECRRLQTIPDWYKMPCSSTQNYKMLGNGWTVEVIKHLLQSLVGQEVEVLSLYDGMNCGRIALEELGCKVRRYVSYEIDKYCIQTTQTNFPDTVQMGDAFKIRELQAESIIKPLSIAI